MKTLRAILWGFLLTAGSLPGVSLAQSLWHTPVFTPLLQAEFAKSYFDNNPYSGFSGAWFFTAVLPARNSVAMVADIPVAHTASEGLFSIEETAVGNPYIGLLFHSTEKPVFAEFGVRVPVSGDLGFAPVAASIASIDRMEAFAEKYLSLNLAVNEYRRNSSGFGFRWRANPVVMLDLDGDSADRDNEALLRYTAQAWYDDADLQAGAGFSGGIFLTDADLFNDRFYTFFDIMASARAGRIHPGVNIHFPVTNGLREALDMNAGFSLVLDLK